LVWFICFEENLANQNNENEIMFKKHEKLNIEINMLQEEIKKHINKN
jgi:hypothetical protein